MVSITGYRLGAPAVVLLTAFALSVPASGSQTPRLRPAFTTEIAPILFARCAGCHRPDGPGPFSLLTYDDARQHAQQIAAVTKSRAMPPWKPEPGYGDFQSERRLSDEEIDLVDQWAQDGAVEGDRSSLPALPRWPAGWQLGEPDLVVTLPEYALRAGAGDVFRNFVVSIPGTGVRYVRGVEFRPGSRAIHHANIRFDPTPASRRLDEADPDPGYDGLIAHSAEYPDGHFNGWTPGQVPSLEPKGFAWRLQQGTDLVVNLHLRPTGKTEPLAAQIGFFFTDDAPMRTPAVVRLGRQDIDIAAGDASYHSTDSYVLPVDVEVEAAQPHAHYRPRELKAWAILPDGTRRWLLYIRDWDFNWQELYRYKTPVALPAGTTLFTEYVFDNSASNIRNPETPPTRVSWGFGSSDEMGDVWFQVVPRLDADLPALTRDVRRKMSTDDTVGYEAMLRANPASVDLRNDVALLYLELGRPGLAVAHFEAATSLRPQSAPAFYNLGTALEAAGRSAEAAAAPYEEALRIDPGYAAAHNNLGNVRLRQGNLSDAMRQYREAIRLKPDYAEAHNNLATVLIAENHVDEAVDHLQQALDVRSDYPAAHFNLARALKRRGDPKGAITHYRTALGLAPDCAACLTELAWILATDPEAAVRNPREAVGLAGRAVELTAGREAIALDALAAAYAAGGRFDEAVSTANKAADAAAAQPVKEFDLTSQIRARLARYRQHMPYIEPSP